MFIFLKSSWHDGNDPILTHFPFCCPPATLIHFRRFHFSAFISLYLLFRSHMFVKASLPTICKLYLILRVLVNKPTSLRRRVIGFIHAYSRPRLLFIFSVSLEVYSQRISLSFCQSYEAEAQLSASQKTTDFSLYS